jgi:hypothetical protein
VYEYEAGSLTRASLCRNFGGLEFSCCALNGLNTQSSTYITKPLGMHWSLQLLMLKPGLGLIGTVTKHFFPFSVTGFIINISNACISLCNDSLMDTVKKFLCSSKSSDRLLLSSDDLYHAY